MDREVEAAIGTLAIDPQRQPLAAESRRSDVELRELLFGDAPFVFRVLFHIDGSEVRVLRVRRAQRRPLTRRAIDEALRPDE